MMAQQPLPTKCCLRIWTYIFGMWSLWSYLLRALDFRELSAIAQQTYINAYNREHVVLIRTKNYHMYIANELITIKEVRVSFN